MTRYERECDQLCVGDGKKKITRRKENIPTARKILQMINPVYDETAAVQIVTIPHETMILEIHFEGEKYLRAKLDGNSRRTSV